MRVTRTSWKLLVGLALVAASCGGGEVLDDDSGTTTSPPANTPPAVTFDGTSWQVTGGWLDGADLVPPLGREATLTVTGGRVSGSTGCNTYTASLRVTSDGAVSFTGFAVTEIGCQIEVMDYERDLLNVLAAVDRFDWDADRLQLSDQAGRARLDLVAVGPVPAASLTGRWDLTSFIMGDTGASVIAGTVPFMVVDPDAGAIRGNGGCNDFGAQVSFADGRMTVSDMTYTEIACDEAVMRQEADLFRMLIGATSWSIAGTILTIEGVDGALTFAIASAQTPEAVALAWIGAVAAGDLDTASSLIAPASLGYVDQMGGLTALSSELAEGWGAWAGAADRRVWSVMGRLSDGTEHSAVVMVGTLTQEGMTERHAAAILMVEVDGSVLVHPFTEPAPVGFVVPRAEFVDRVAPDVSFEFGIPEGSELLVFLDEAEVLATESTPIGDGIRVTASPDLKPQPGEHILTVIHHTASGDTTAQAALFATYP